jgi:sugar phosphate isomerase/epimerase
MDQVVGAQTIPWGETIKERMPEILRFLASQEYRGVETGMRHFDAADPGMYRDLYQETGVRPLGLHSGGQFWKPEAAEEERRKLRDAIAFAEAVGFRHLVVSGNKAETVASMKEAAVTYADLGRRCREAGLSFCYHNHNWELADDAAILDTLLLATEPGEVSLVLDVAWAHIGGIQVGTLLERYGNRVAYLHIKDVRGERFCELGRGEMNLPEVLRLAEKQRIEWLVVEQDYTDYTPEESMRVNRDYLRALGV